MSNIKFTILKEKIKNRKTRNEFLTKIKLNIIRHSSNISNEISFLKRTGLDEFGELEKLIYLDQKLRKAAIKIRKIMLQ